MQITGMLLSRIHCTWYHSTKIYLHVNFLQRMQFVPGHVKLVAITLLEAQIVPHRMLSDWRALAYGPQNLSESIGEASPG